MLSRWMKQSKDQDGNVIIEASFVMTFAVVLIAVLINIGLILYEQTLLEATANDTAAKVANVYASLCREPEFGYVSDSNFYKMNLYRYLKNFFNSSLDSVSENRGVWYSLYRVKKYKLMKDSQPNFVVDVKGRKGSILLNQVEVSVESRFQIPLTAIWGGDNETVFRAVARANCIDLLDYFDTVMMIEDDIIKKLDSFTETFTRLVEVLDFSSLVE